VTYAWRLSFHIFEEIEMDKSPRTGQGLPVLVSAIRPAEADANTPITLAQGPPVPIDLTNRFVGRTLSQSELEREGARHEDGRWLIDHEGVIWELATE
jgi:hypothetical protein